MLTIAAVIALVAPFLLWTVWWREVITVYRGPAKVTSVYESVCRDGKFCARLQIPDTNPPEAAIVYVEGSTKEQVERLHDQNVPVTLKQRTLGAPWVDSVDWGNGREFHASDNDYSRVLMCLYYLGLGLLTVLFTKGSGGTTLVWPFVGISLVCAGFTIGLTPKNISRQGNNFLGRSHGSGTLTHLSIIVVLSVVTGLCFATGSFLVLFPGFPVAFALGNLLALLGPKFLFKS